MHAVRFTVDGGEPRIGRLDGGTVIDAGPAGPHGFVPTDEAWQQLGSASGAAHPLETVALLAPVLPRQILAIGLNYRAHAIESELAIPEVPVVFAMYPSSITGPHDDIVIPREETRTDYEGEVAVVIGKRAYRASVEDAWSYVGAVTALDDVSGPPGAARDAAAAVHAGQELRHVHTDRAEPRAGDGARSGGHLRPDDGVRRADAGLVDERPDLLDRRDHRVPDPRHHPRAGRSDRDGHARRRRRLARAAALPARRRRRGGGGRRRRLVAEPGARRARSPGSTARGGAPPSPSCPRRARARRRPRRPPRRASAARPGARRRACPG